MSSNPPPRPSSAALRASILPTTHRSRPSTTTSAASAKNRHLSHLHSQLAQLSANLADLENLVRVTAIQADSIRGLGGWCGGLFMAASKVLGEETVANGSQEAGKTDDDEQTT
ncbi:hypothetical protein FH972_021287 [Carpinus fangiana]|uniref:Uncharacterized protein n=1 Tax=Carpinus fangiana TaxID=176857 RepID=A0A5N6KP99_9ROSI|nr:hypothetical protein FH972_021287 [Carpinus fangiana]